MPIKDYKNKNTYSKLGLKKGKAAIKREVSPITPGRIFLWSGLFALVIFVNYLAFVHMGSIDRKEIKMSPVPKERKESGNFMEQLLKAHRSYQGDDLKKAAEAYTKAIGIKPEDITSHFNRGIVYSKMGLHDKAIDDYNKVIELNPDYAEAYNNRGWAYIQKGLFDRAIQDCNKAIVLDPEMAAAYHTRGVSYTHIGLLDKAKTDFQRSCELGDNNGCIEFKELLKEKKT
jgi:tetratricopeptide (TPR) repeat protein